MGKKEIADISARLLSIVQDYAPYRYNIPDAFFTKSSKREEIERLFCNNIMKFHMMGYGCIGDLNPSWGGDKPAFYYLEHQSIISIDAVMFQGGICGTLSMFVSFLARTIKIAGISQICFSPVAIPDHTFLVIYKKTKVKQVVDRRFYSLKKFCQSFPDKDAFICDPWLLVSTNVGNYDVMKAKLKLINADHIYSEYPDGFTVREAMNFSDNINFSYCTYAKNWRQKLPQVSLRTFNKYFAKRFLTSCFNRNTLTFDVPIDEMKFSMTAATFPKKRFLLRYYKERGHRWLSELRRLTKDAYLASRKGYNKKNDIYFTNKGKRYIERKTNCLRKLHHYCLNLRVEEINPTIVGNILRLVIGLALTFRTLGDDYFLKNQPKIQNPRIDDAEVIKKILAFLSNPKNDYCMHYFKQETARDGAFNVDEKLNAEQLYMAIRRFGLVSSTRYLYKKKFKSFFYDEFNKMDKLAKNLKNSDYHHEFYRRIKEYEDRLERSKQQEEKNEPANEVLTKEEEAAFKLQFAALFGDLDLGDSDDSDSED
ncbi:MAG: hypothetical protein GY718_10220 [Lentisphaerae bacterium]|nr:hypothetical protein [Lentisphaerota bacterium]